MNIDLSSTPKERKAKFFALKTFTDLATLLEVKPAYLNYVLHMLPIEGRYTTFEIAKKKRGEIRVIYNPIPPLKIIQRKLLQVLECVYEPRCSAYGFIKHDTSNDGIKRNIVSNAAIHKGQRHVLNIDLENFFPSIHFGRVRGLFIKPPYNLPYKVAQVIAQICCYDGGLPQGAPTSPILSNMICNKLDSQLQRLAQHHRCYYTRYADDITFSTSLRYFPPEIAYAEDGVIHLGSELIQIICENNKFSINSNKIRLRDTRSRQEVTGLTVNKFPNVNRKYIRQIRAMMHDWDINGLDAAQEKYRTKYHSKHRYYDKREIMFRDVVLGKIEFVGMVRGKKDTLYLKLLSQMSKLPNSNLVIPIEVENYMVEKPAKIFLSYAREDVAAVQKIHQSLKRVGHKPWMDKIDIVTGEKWERAIKKAIKEADLFVACLSSTSVKKRGYLQKEFKMALEIAKEKLDTDIWFIPLRLDECDVPDELSEYQWLDLFEDDAWKRFMRAIEESQIRISKLS